MVLPEESLLKPPSSWRSKLQEVKTVLDAPEMYPGEEAGPKRHYKYHSLAAHLDKRGMKQQLERSNTFVMKNEALVKIRDEILAIEPRAAAPESERVQQAEEGEHRPRPGSMDMDIKMAPTGWSEKQPMRIQPEVESQKAQPEKEQTLTKPGQ